jgi:Tfp pilus assembly protein PilW
MLIALRSRLRTARAAKSDAGVSLAELLVAIGIGTILGAMSLGMFVNVNTSTARTTDRTINTASARNTLLAWTNYLKVADGTTAGTSTNRIEWMASNDGDTRIDDILFYADLNNRGGGVDSTGAPTMVWLRRDTSSNLVEEQFPSTATAGTAPTVCRRLASRVTDMQTKIPTATGTLTTINALFTPTTSGGADLTGNDLGQAPTPSTGCQNLPVTVPSQTAAPDPIAQANLQNIRGITIAFAVAEKQRSTDKTQFLATAVLPTLGGS